MLSLAFAWLGGAAFVASLLYFLYSYLVSFRSMAAGGAALLPVVIDVVLFSIFALHHSVFARTGIKHYVRSLFPPVLERAVYTVVSSVLFALVCWAWQPVPGMAYQLDGGWRLLGYGSVAAGILVTAIGARALDGLALAGIRQVLDARRSTRRSPPALKMDGLYAFVRHPVYFGWVLIVFGVPTMTMTRLTFAVVSTLYLAVAVPFEERSLIETFGPEYASYQRRTRWRMIPGLY